MGVANTHSAQTVQEQMEVPAGDVAVPYRVGGQLTEDQHDVIVRAGAVRDAQVSVT